MKKLLYVVAAGVLAWPVGVLAQGAPPQDEPVQDQQDQNQDAGHAAEAPPAPQVEVLNPGAEPHRELRYAPEVDRRERATFKNTMSATISTNGQQMPAQEVPTITMVIGATTSAVTEDRFGYLFDFEDVQVGEGDASAMIRQTIAPLLGVSGVAENALHGELLVFETIGLEEMPAMARSQIQSMSSQASQFVQVLPQEPVGVGARWRVVMLQTNGDVQMEQTATATLKSIEGDVITISMDITQSAPEQDMGQQMGQNMRLLSLTGKGRAETKLDLNRLVPLRSTSTMTTDMRVSIGESTFDQSMTMKTELTGKLVEVAPGQDGEPEDAPDRSGNDDGNG